MIKVVLALIFTLSSYSLAQWKKVSAEDDITIFSLPAKSGVLPFKAVGTVKDNIEKILYILKDHKQKPKWAPKLDSVKVHHQLSKNVFIFSEYYRTPWPATDREFLLKGEIFRIDHNTVLLKAFSVDETQDYSRLKNKSYIQASVKYINLRLTKIDLNQTKVEFEFHGDMKGWMPNWLMNLIQKKWPLRFIQALRKQSAIRKQKLVRVLFTNGPTEGVKRNPTRGTDS